MKLVLKYFRETVKSGPRQFLTSMAMIAALTAVEIMIPWLLRRFVGRIAAEYSAGILAAGIAFFALLLLLQVFINIARFAALDRFGGRYLESLTLRLEEAMANTFYSEIEKAQPGIVRNVLYSDVFNVFRTVGHCLPSMLGALAVLAASLAISFAYSGRIAAFIFAAVAVGLLLSWSSRKILTKYAGQTNGKMKRHDAWCTQFVEMLPLVQTHTLLPYYQEKTSENLRDFIATAVREDKRVYFWTGLVSGYHSLFTIVLSALLAIPAAGNSIPNLVFYTTIASLAMQQTQLLESLFQQTIRYYPSFAHVQTLRSLPARQGRQEVPPIRTVEFRDVSFAYPNGVQALSHVNATLSGGDVAQLQGGNGCGKSTLIKLLTGLYRPTQGQILLDGKPLETFSHDALKKRILYINQDEKCLNESFRRYLELVTGKQPSDQEYRRLLELVQLRDDGREITENGNSLSVGQRKKLFLMKMLLCQQEASIIILDEVTACLDAQTTATFREWLRETSASEDKIILLVDHTLEAEPPVNTCLRFVNGEATQSAL